MKVFKIAKDYVIKKLFGEGSIPRGLYELSQYALHMGSIGFNFIKNEDGSYTAVSTNFRHGSIITQGKDMEELDRNIKDAILTSFEIPSSYRKEARVTRVGDHSTEYALA